jgi:uncharacterized membrane protein
MVAVALRKSLDLSVSVIVSCLTLTTQHTQYPTSFSVAVLGVLHGADEPQMTKAPKEHFCSREAFLMRGGRDLNPRPPA